MPGTWGLIICTHCHISQNITQEIRIPKIHDSIAINRWVIQYVGLSTAEARIRLKLLEQKLLSTTSHSALFGEPQQLSLCHPKALGIPLGLDSKHPAWHMKPLDVIDFPPRSPTSTTTEATLVHGETQRGKHFTIRFSYCALLAFQLPHCATKQLHRI